jgi:hypothetical protein
VRHTIVIEVSDNVNENDLENIVKSRMISTFVPALKDQDEMIDYERVQVADYHFEDMIERGEH